MSALSLTTETVILLLRFAIVAVLYLFLWQVIAVIWRDLRRPASGEAEPAHPMGKLIVVSSGATSYQPGYSFPIFGSATIGRSANNTIVLSDSFVSSNHAVISFRDGEWWLADLGARNGSWVNSERISGEVQIRPGDTVALGQVRLKLAR
jgi:hypothetical protein